jgi:hypothetical protein
MCENGYFPGIAGRRPGRRTGRGEPDMFIVGDRAYNRAIFDFEKRWQKNIG